MIAEVYQFMKKLEDGENLGTETAPVFFRSPTPFLKEFDDVIFNCGYARRSEAIREGMRLLLEDLRKREKRITKLRTPS